jgi:hypothetical protein
MDAQYCRELNSTSARQSEELLNWRTYHLFYHADQDPMVRLLVRPLIIQLLDAGAIDRFFFVRYALGGPHLRLRWRLKEENAAGPVESLLAGFAGRFFSQFPSVHPVSEERIRQANSHILQNDPGPNPGDDRIFPDNSWHAFENNFEVARYGGPERLGASLDLFCLSSIVAMQHLQADAESRGSLLRLALHLAWGFAENQEDFFDMVDYYAPSRRPEFQGCVNAGNAAFERRPEYFMKAVKSELEAITIGRRSSLAGAAVQLAADLQGMAVGARRYAATSHIHMTANRLGLKNSEEAYISQILSRATRELRLQEPSCWEALWQMRAGFVTNASRTSLSAILLPELDLFVSRGRDSREGHEQSGTKAS